jgi:hypothetical protein
VDNIEKFKPLDDTNKEELINIIRTIASDMRLWRCPKCGNFSRKTDVCWRCGYYDSAE